MTARYRYTGKFWRCFSDRKIKKYEIGLLFCRAAYIIKAIFKDSAASAAGNGVYTDRRPMRRSRRGRPCITAEKTARGLLQKVQQSPFYIFSGQFDRKIEIFRQCSILFQLYLANIQNMMYNTNSVKREFMV